MLSSGFGLDPFGDLIGGEHSKQRVEDGEIDRLAPHGEIEVVAQCIAGPRARRQDAPGALLAGCVGLANDEHLVRGWHG